MSFNKKVIALGLGVVLLAGAIAAAVMSMGLPDDGNTMAEGVMTNPEEAINEKTVSIIDDKCRTTYEVFVYSFCDSDGDGVGDLQGLISKLDYINDGDPETDTDLGCNQIWLMPVSPSTTYHKYDVTDYMGIDPEYGTMVDFDMLVEACHSRGIHVIIDQVYNHSSVEHPWFKEAAEFLADHPGITFDENGDYSASFYIDCPKLSYYRFANEQLQGYEPLPGTEYYYEARFWSGMPDLNLDSRSVRDEIAKITEFWTEHGVDGFRLDAVTYYYTGEDSKNIEFLTWLNDTVKEQNPDAYIVGEAWTNSATYYKYYASGIDSFFDFDYAGSEGTIAGVARGTTPASRYGEALVSTQEALEQYATAIDAPFYVNHDMARSAGYFTGKGSEDKIKLAAAMNLLMTGNAFIYYGEELGMKGSGKDENKRAPMYWSADPAAEGMCKGPKDMDKFEMKYPSLEEQAQDPTSIYNYYKAAIKARNIFPAIARGRTSTLDPFSDKDICAFVRKLDADPDGRWEEQFLSIFINTSDEARVVDLSNYKGDKSIAYQLNTGDTSSSIENDTLTLAPYSIVIFEG